MVINMNKRIKRVMAIVLAVFMAISTISPMNVRADNTNSLSSKNDKTPAFPGAEGGGMYASGGRGYDVYVVTNLLDYTTGETPIEGSLRYGLKNNTTIVFNVAGNIELKQSLRFAGLENITIAGQTAPGDGITISGWDTNISDSKNTIIRYIRFRPGAINVHTGGDSMDAMWGRNNNTFIVDHCSFSWNTDECLSLYLGENGTVQWSLIYESLTLSGHSKGRHGYGGISGGDNVTFHHNLFANHTSRNPRIGGGYAGKGDAGQIGVVELSNNITYNWGFNTIYGGGFAYTNYINNYQVSGPGTRDNISNTVAVTGESGKISGFYGEGNYIADYTNRNKGVKTGVLDFDSPYVIFGGDLTGETPSTIRNKRYLSAESLGSSAGITNIGFDTFKPDNVQKVFKEVLNKAGATYPKRDAIDARITAEVENGLGRYINTEHEVGGYISESGVITASRSADFDKDADGMADAWEIKNKLNPNDPSDRNYLNSKGYTNLEVYLNSLVDMGYEAENPVAIMKSPTNNQYLEEGKIIDVEVEAHSKKGNDIEKVEFYCSTTTETKLVGTVISKDVKKKTKIYKSQISGLSDGSYFISARVYDSKGNQTQTTASEIHVNADASTLVEQGWYSTDIGKPAIYGTGSYVNGVLTVKGNGKLGTKEGSIAGTKAADATSDDFHFVYQELTGDVEVIAKLDCIASVDNHAFTGIMIRDDLDNNSKTAALGLSWVKYTNLPWSMYLTGRDVKGGEFDLLGENLDSQEAAAKYGISLQPDIPFKKNGVSLGYFMKLIRNGDTFLGYSSSDGANWKLIGKRTIKMDDTVYVGFAVDSNKVANDLEQINTARFSSVQVNTNLHDINFNLTNLTVEDAPEVIGHGQNLKFIITANEGFQVPDFISYSMGGSEGNRVSVNKSDSFTGTVIIENITDVLLVSGGGIHKIKLNKEDEGDFLSLKWDKKSLILEQTANDGQMTQNVNEGSESFAKDVSYLLFPESNDEQTMELDISITGKIDNDEKRGLFLGAFQVGDIRKILFP